jgi:hypothetical protein
MIAALNAADVDTDMLKRFSAAIDNDNLEIVKFLNQPFKRWEGASALADFGKGMHTCPTLSQALDL